MRISTLVQDFKKCFLVSCTYCCTDHAQVDNLGVLVPNLTELRFGRGSTLASFRDFGSSLVNLRVLWLPACGVCHLDGVGALTGLEELYLAFNDVEDLTSIALHDRLEVSEVHVPWNDLALRR